MLHERKRCRKFCTKISHMNSVVYKEYKNENGKRSDYNLCVGHRYSLHGARLTLAANTTSQVTGGGVTKIPMQCVKFPLHNLGVK
jgi:hypothetical protein